MSLPRTPPTGVGVLDRSMGILDAVGAGAASFTEIVAATGLTRSTTHRLVRALEALGLLSSSDGAGYRIGPRLLGLAAGAMRDLPLRELAHPALERLARETGESAQLFVRDGDRRVCVDAVESASELRTIVEVGSALPLTAGSAGKLFLGYLPHSVRDELITRAERLTDRTPVGDALRRQAELARRRGHASSSGERQPGVGSVSAPVIGPFGDLMAVVSVSGPSTRIGRVGAGRYASAVIAAAHQIERGLGVDRA